MKQTVETIEQIESGQDVLFNFATGKLEQNSRNKLKSALTNAIHADLADATVDDPNVLVALTEKGLGIRIDTPEGTVSYVLELTMKSLDFDLEAEADKHIEKNAERAARKANIAKRKEEKILHDEKIREQKRLEREAKAAKEQQ